MKQKKFLFFLDNFFNPTHFDNIVGMFSLIRSEVQQANAGINNVF